MRYAIKNTAQSLRLSFYQPRAQILFKFFAFICLMLLCGHVRADDTDMLQGTDTSAWATFNGTGKNYLYLGEGVAALFMYIKTKNLMMLTGIIVISIFINVILHFAGKS